MKLKKTLTIAVILFITFIGLWELYWRSKPDFYRAYLEDSRYLWAEERAKLENANNKDVVLIGASRTGYNFNTHVWEKVQGIKPINLTTNGKPPGPFFEDIVNNTSFNGTLIIGVTPVAFFEYDSPSNWRWKSAKIWVDHYHNQTYAQKIGHFLSKPLQRNFVFLSAAELNAYNDLDLKSLIKRIKIKGRIPNNGFQLINFGYNDEDRNLIMFPNMVTDPTFAKKITDQWDIVIPTLPDFEVIKNHIPIVFESINTLIQKFKARGGKIIFIRHKAEDGWNKHSKRMFPKDKVWDVFVEGIDCPSYHFEDYEIMSKYTLPDWSHMSAEDAKTHTKDMVNLMIADGHLINMK